MTLPVIENSIDTLLKNLRNIDIPMGMLKQYMPLQYAKVRDGKLGMEPIELVKHSIVTIVEDYNYAVKYNYIINGVF